MPLVKDMLERRVEVPDTPQLIVSLVPSQTELLADIGLEAEVVGITKFCVHPEYWFRTKTRVGGTKSVDIEKLKTLMPDLIIANKEENLQAEIEALSRIAPIWVSDIKNLEDALEMIHSLSTICGKAAKGKEIVSQIQLGFQGFYQEKNRLVFAQKKAAYCIWKEPWMWAGKDTYIDSLLKISGLENCFGNLERYPSLDLFALRGLKPDVVLLSSEPYPFKEKHLSEIKIVLPDTQVLLVDGEMFSWYGSRLLQVPNYLSFLLKALSWH